VYTVLTSFVSTYTTMATAARIDDLSIGAIRTRIPSECFQKDTVKSLSYMLFDTQVIALLYLIDSHIPFTWDEPYVGSAIIWKLVWWNAVGLMMWCVFVVGHDCGHTTFSNNSVVNDICGHICHGFIGVPFWPWAWSHRKHHKHHNSKENDLSHPWFERSEQYAWLLHTSNQWSILIPFMYTAYLLMGAFDGCHFNPLSSLFTTTKQRIECIFSTFVCCVFWYVIWVACDRTTRTFIVQYVIPVLVFHSWLYVVTYLHHHQPNTKVYPNSKWTFLLGAYQTVDRTYGYGIDWLTHNITTDHFVHHLFFLDIPHYHLPAATNAIKELLKDKRVHINTPDALSECIKLRTDAPLVALSNANDGIYVLSAS